MKGFVGDIEEITLHNSDFRRVLYTGKKLQLVLMSLAPGEDIGEEVHPGESVEEKISLSERFGLWISFYPFTQDDYLAAVARWLEHFGVRPAAGAKEQEARTREALQWALQRGSRSGRVAWQFARGYAGAAALRGKKRHTSGR